MLQAKYQPNRPSGSREVVCMVFAIYGPGGHLKFRIMTFLDNFV